MKGICLVCLLLVAAVACARKPQVSLPVYGEIPDFELTAETGKPFRGAELRGKIWIADFIFTNCPGPCPRMSSQMRLIQESLADVAELRLVSFTVDPERDSPEVLAAYARRYQAQPGRWIFLTGPMETLHRLSRDAFKVGDVDGSLNHSTHFVLVDQRGRIRAYYGTAEGLDLRKIRADVEALRKEPA
ncbi:MAG: SCO family protein [Bryobacterales bacterium]|nr:SCO family protein [Bryobacteraceae bacterium]MDW8355926.1 SCO family protein [Bryobacterales bacterium]